MAEFVHALPLGEHTDHPRRGRLDDLEMQRAGDVPGHRHHHHDDAAAAEITVMEREALGYGIGRPNDRRRLLDQTAHAIAPLPGGYFLVAPGRRSGPIGRASWRERGCRAVCY